MTNQETFDRVAEHLLKQDAKSLRHGACAYRGDAGFKCAVGCLISDDEYGPGIEGFGVWTPWLIGWCRQHGYSTALLANLQQVHDR